MKNSIRNPPVLLVPTNTSSPRFHVQLFQLYNVIDRRHAVFQLIAVQAVSSNSMSWRCSSSIYLIPSRTNLRVVDGRRHSVLCFHRFSLRFYMHWFICFWKAFIFAFFVSACVVARNANEGFNVMVTAFLFMGHASYAFYVARTQVSASKQCVIRTFFLFQCAFAVASAATH